MRIWGSEYGDADYQPDLIHKCLMKFDKNGEQTIHDLLHDMGQEIVDNSHKGYWKQKNIFFLGGGGRIKLCPTLGIKKNMGEKV